MGVVQQLARSKSFRMRRVRGYEFYPNGRSDSIETEIRPQKREIFRIELS